MQANRIMLGFLEVNHLANYPRTYQGWRLQAFPFNKPPVGFDGLFRFNSEVLRSKGPTLYVVCCPFLPLAPSSWTCRWCLPTRRGSDGWAKPWGWFIEGYRRLGKFLPRNRGLLEVSKKSSLSHPWMKWKRLKDSVFGMCIVWMKLGWSKFRSDIDVHSNWIGETLVCATLLHAWCCSMDGWIGSLVFTRRNSTCDGQIADCDRH